MKRKIIRIDEEKCTGCGLCVPDCPEGAIQIIDGKARLVSDLFCDGLGACLGSCPEGAIETEEREAEPYDERRVMENIVKAGESTVKAHLDHLREHGQEKYLQEAIEYLRETGRDIPEPGEKSACSAGVCPGMASADLRSGEESRAEPSAAGSRSELIQWPLQLKLLNPSAECFRESDLLVSADCVPFAAADFHSRFLRSRPVVVFCPKLDDSYEEYADKLAAIIRENNVRSVTVLRMQVPCCRGAFTIAEEALRRAGRDDIKAKEIVISLKGEIL